MTKTFFNSSLISNVFKAVYRIDKVAGCASGSSIEAKSERFRLVFLLDLADRIE